MNKLVFFNSYRSTLLRGTAILAMVVLNAQLRLFAQQDDSQSSASIVIATVNGKELTAAELKLSFFAKQLSGDNSQQSHQELIQTLIDRELVRQFLAKRKIEADSILVEQRMNVIKSLIEKKKEDLASVLEKSGLTEESLEQLIAQQITWKTYVNSVLTEARIEQFWKENKEQFDGTEVIASQIFKRLIPSAADADIEAATKELAMMKSSIEQSKLSFAEAATQHSESPSGKSGGALGSFEYHGSVAEAIAAAAFGTSPGAISEPFRSRYGMHIVKVQKRIPGDLSLEDARPQVVKVLSEQLWEELVERLRKSSRIQLQK